MTHDKKLNQKSQTHTEHSQLGNDFLKNIYIFMTSSEHDFSFEGSIKRLSDDLYMHLLMPTQLFV